MGSSSTRTRWAARFEAWARPLSETEDQKCQNAVSVIESAIRADDDLRSLSVDVFAQGSYVANTNVRADSDIDICVRCTNTYFYDLPPGTLAAEVPIYPATLTYADYKNKLQRALQSRFGVYGVVRGDKAFNVKENTYRIKADVVPAFEYKQFFYSSLGLLSTRIGISFLTDSGTRIVNWPKQTLANGRAKNDRTRTRYKKVVRVLKGLRNEMEEKGYESAKTISSFQLACLAYNVSDGFYGNADLYDDVKGVSGQIWYAAYEPQQSLSWTEIDEIKPLFPVDQPNRRKEVADFFWSLRTYSELME